MGRRLALIRRNRSAIALGGVGYGFNRIYLRLVESLGP